MHYKNVHFGKWLKFITAASILLPASTPAVPQQPQSDATVLVTPNCLTHPCQPDIPELFDQWDRAQRLKYGYGMTNNHEIAYRWYMRSANNGDARAMHNTGIMLTRGMGVARDIDAGRKWLQRAAQAGLVEPLLALAELAAYADKNAPDYRYAYSLYHRAAREGDARAMNALGNLYATGRGIARIWLDACVWYSRAAKAGHVTAGLAAKLSCQQLTADEKLELKWLLRMPN